MHVRRGDRYIPERRCAELADILRLFRVFKQAAVGRFIQGRAGIEERVAPLVSASLEADRAEVPPTVALEAAAAFARIEDDLTALGGLVEPVTTFTYNRSMLDYYIKRQHERQKALPAAEVDLLLDQQETALLDAAAATISALPGQVAIEMVSTAPPPPDPSIPIWTRTEVPESTFKTQDRKRGPKADTENHEKVVRIIRAFGENWTADENLLEICEELDRQQVPAPKTWATRKDGVARTWSRGLHHYQHLVIKSIKDRLKATTGSGP